MCMCMYKCAMYSSARKSSRDRDETPTNQQQQQIRDERRALARCSVVRRIEERSIRIFALLIALSRITPLRHHNARPDRHWLLALVCYSSDITGGSVDVGLVCLRLRFKYIRQQAWRCCYSYICRRVSSLFRCFGFRTSVAFTCRIDMYSVVIMVSRKLDLTL